MKLRFSIKYRFLAIMLLILIMVSAVGLLTYQGFVKVLDNAKESGKSYPVLNTTKNLIFQLTQAENEVKTYTLTQDSIFLDQYDKYAKQIKIELKNLEFDMIKTEMSKAPLDSLKILVNKKLTIYDSLLVLQNEFRVQKALQKVTKSIDDVAEKVTTEEESDDERKWRLFKSRKKNPVITRTEMRVDYDAVKNNLEAIQNTETSREEEQLLKEFSLLQKDNFYSNEIQKIIVILENQKIVLDKKRTAETSQIIRGANTQIVIFCLIITILLIITSATIIRYITRSTRYRKVLKKARNEARNLAKAKEHFVATVSHEIRTPMNIISGFADQLSSTKLNKEQKDHLQTIISASSHLLKLINEVLDFTKLQNYKLKLEANPFNIRHAVKDVEGLMSPLANAKKIDLEFQMTDNIPEIVIGDSVRLSQILINVVSNAIKFTDDGIVSVSISSVDLDDDFVTLEFSVTDTGIGMSHDKVERVFEAFEQAEVSTTRTYGGTGLGLSITKKLIELHEGSVEVHSAEEVGTEVLIEIRYPIGHLDSVNVIETQKSITPDFSQYNVLIADDEPFNRKLLATILTKYNTKISEAKNGKEAIFLAERTHFDLILMDARMPEMNGIEAAKGIKNTTLNTETPIIALSAAVSEEDKKGYKNAGMAGFVPKPFKEELLIATMQQLLSSLATNPVQQSESKEKLALDFSELKSISNGDTKFYVEMLETFSESTQTGVQQIKIHLRENQIDQIAAIAHKISSPCKHLEANELYKTLKKIECLAKVSFETSDELEKLIEHVENECENVIQKVSIELNKTK